MHTIYAYSTARGVFYIRFIEPLYFLLLDGKMLRSYASAEEAAEALALGEHQPPDAAPLEIPADLDKWRKIS